MVALKCCQIPWPLVCYKNRSYNTHYIVHPGHFWLGYIKMLGHQQMSTHLSILKDCKIVLVGFRFAANFANRYQTIFCLNVRP